MTLSDWQAEQGGVTLGAGTAYEFTGPIEGLGVPRPRTYDTPRGPSPGDAAAADIPGRRVVVLTVAVVGDGPADCWGKAEALNAAWAPVAADVALDIRMPGGATMRYMGRPRACDLDLTDLGQGTAAAHLTFEALDPTVTVVTP